MHHDNMVVNICPSTTSCVLKTMVGPGSSTFEVFLDKVAFQSDKKKIMHVAYLHHEEIATTLDSLL